MFYSLLFLTALLSQLQLGSSAATMTYDAAARGSMAALNNLVVIGDPAHTSDVGSVAFAFYTYQITSGAIAVDEFAQVKAMGGKGDGAGAVVPLAAIPATGNDLAGNSFEGLGHDTAIADMSTVFVSQTSIAKQTGRVVVYEGNITKFTQKQLLIPYDRKQRQDSAAAFGESIAAKSDALAVGCQNCNSSAPVFSGAVYVYKPTKEGRWSESQVLTADGILFLGERVALHGSVLVAAGDDSSTFTHAASSSHNFGNIANSAVIFEEKGPKFEQRQVITPRAGNTREGITGVTVFDETIAITTMGSDVEIATGTPSYTYTQRDKVYIYYPMNKRYGLEPKGKPSPQQWTNIQILTSAATANVRYGFGGVGSPDTSISMNTLQYITTDGAGTSKVSIARTSRDCLSCKFAVPTVTATALTVPGTAVLMTTLMAADSTAFYTFNTKATEIVNDPEFNSFSGKCMTIVLQDQFNDGWGIASLSIEGPDGNVDKFTLQCDTANPNVFQYCPTFQKAGKYHVHVDKGEETPYGWEIMFKLAVGSTWYYGDRHTHIDFLWDEKYNDFHVGASKGLLPLIDTCKTCPSKPAAKRRSLSNLRSLHHKGSTSSPTISSAPTLTGGSSVEWQYVVIASGAWFDSDYEGINYYISTADGKKLLRTGTKCLTAAANCWEEMPDGDYEIRVGASIADMDAITPVWSFCGVSTVLDANSGFKFSVVDQQCYPGVYTEAHKYCIIDGAYAYYLNVDLLLSGASSSLSNSDKDMLSSAVTETMVSVLGSAPSTVTVSKETAANGGLTVSLSLEFSSDPDATALDNFVRDTSSASSLLKYDVIGSKSLAANFLQGEVSGVTIVSANTALNTHDFSAVDESGFQTVTDTVWHTASAEQSSNNFNTYAEYVAEGAYAIAAVAAVLAVSMFVKRAVSKKASVADEVSA